MVRSSLTKVIFGGKRKNMSQGNAQRVAEATGRGPVGHDGGGWREGPGDSNKVNGPRNQGHRQGYPDIDGVSWPRLCRASRATVYTDDAAAGYRGHPQPA